MKESKQKIIFRIEVVENDLGGIKWKTSIIGQKPAPITEDFKQRIYDDLNIEVDACEYSTLQEIIE